MFLRWLVRRHLLTQGNTSRCKRNHGRHSWIGLRLAFYTVRLYLSKLLSQPGTRACLLEEGCDQCVAQRGAAAGAQHTHDPSVLRYLPRHSDESTAHERKTPESARERDLSGW
eukprot:2937958-Prymnesium_polylepis.2